MLGMFLMGIFYRVIQQMFGTASGLGTIVIGSYVFTHLLLIESSLSLVIGGLVWTLVLFMILHYFVKATESSKLTVAPVYRA
jgi:ABC-type uncharacterized transport system permease subunit